MAAMAVKGRPQLSQQSEEDDSSHEHSIKGVVLQQGVPNGDVVEEAGKGQLDETKKGLVVIVMLSLCLSVFLCALDATIITTALPTIAEQFNSTAGYTWIASSYLMSEAATTPLWGKLGDIFGRKPALLLSNLLFLVGSVLCGASTSVEMLIASRAIQGAGAGGIITLVDVIISDLFSMRTRGAYLGLVGATWALACGLGPILGGVFTSQVSWRWCFYVNAPLDGVALIITFLFPLSTPRTPIIQGLLAVDWSGTLTITGGVLMILLGLTYGGITYPWNSATVICLIVFGAVTLVLFVFTQWKVARYPIMPLDLFSNRSNVGSLAVTFAHGWFFMAVFYFMPLYFQAGLGANALLSGVYLLPAVLATGVSAAITGGVISATGRFIPPILLGMTLALLGIGLFIDLDQSSGWAKIILYQLVVGCGLGPNFQAPLVALQAHIAQRDVSTATATFNLVRVMANAISVVIGDVVVANQMNKQQTSLRISLGEERAELLAGENAVASVGLMKKWPSEAREIGQRAFSRSLRTVWIVETCFVVLGLLFCALLRPNVLSTDLEKIKQGLETEEKNALARKAEKEGLTPKGNA
ncbi:Efflux pump dotC [Fulvia fulva]|nr:Efflux pump dotC [Fulvia fulva]KAK4615097.1 Efflux pump dotC [Fulvia fulva]WPV19907.1 Efflux pump dotC [Fulvia fulva]WPV34737.1 Efflux pump dotC [Fulvia fulva]